MPVLASLKKRAIAFLVDVFILISGTFTMWVLFWILMAFATAIGHWLLGSIIGDAPARAVLGGVLRLLWLFVALVLPVALFGYYFARTESSVLQASVGKMFLGLRVVDEEGNRLDMKKAWWRAMNKLLSMLTLFLGFIPAFFNPERQALHDKMSGTLVITK